MLAGLAFSVSVQSGVFQTTGYEKEVAARLSDGAFAHEIARRMRHNVKNAFVRASAYHRKTRHSTSALPTLADKSPEPVPGLRLNLS